MKYIIDQIKLKVPQSERETVLKLIKEIKEHLQKHDALPHKYEVFQDIDKEPEILMIYMGFESDPHYDAWELKFKEVPKIDAYEKIRTYFLGYNYLEKINL